VSAPLQVEIELPGDLARFRLPEGVEARLHALLDRQDQGPPLTDAGWQEAEGLVDLAEFLTLLRWRAERSQRGSSGPRGELARASVGRYDQGARAPSVSP
jgi:hypothetical protein